MYGILAALLGYVFGCINGSEIIGKYKKINIKQTGMKNAGATNTAVILGVKYGIIVAAIDILKAIISLYILSTILNNMFIMPDIQTILLFINGLFVIIGHNYPITMKFQGGKGTASLFGVLLYFDWRFAVLGFMILVIFSLISNYFVFGTLILYVSFMLYTTYIYGRVPGVITLVYMGFFFIKHIDNFKRIVNKEEVMVSSLFRREAN
ncbi:MAG TPA: glycerol-3-phosphate acyltransferase [Pseudogracilibacillus sp.]|nr:glycerol-3-phosphate acyltransferase [Pseudogracilibacillus sp.]